MEFSKKYLSKYGWEEGQGLGKTRNGIKDAIKPKLKFDKAGIGFDPSQEFTDHWWEKIYNDALKDKKSLNNKEEWLAEGEETSHTCYVLKQKKLDKDSNSLFKACEGRTAHKGARHGLRLSGELQRLEQQEKILFSKKFNKHGNDCIQETDVNPKAALENSTVFFHNFESKKKLKYIIKDKSNRLKKCNKKDKINQKVDNS